MAMNALKEIAYRVFNLFYQDTSYRLSERMPVSGSLRVCVNSVSEIPRHTVEKSNILFFRRVVLTPWVGVRPHGGGQGWGALAVAAAPSHLARGPLLYSKGSGDKWNPSHC